MTANETLAAIREITEAFEKIDKIFDDMEKKIEQQSPIRQAA